MSVCMGREARTRQLRSHQAAAMRGADPASGKKLRAVFVYFDNDQVGYAAQKARTVHEMVD